MGLEGRVNLGERIGRVSFLTDRGRAEAVSAVQSGGVRAAGVSGGNM